MPDGSKTIWCVAWQSGGARTTTVAVRIAATINNKQESKVSRRKRLRVITAASRLLALLNN